ncbi:MAG: glycosyltransferase [Deltaproteobacteria bacterium]|nr:glycosyltransferase [Deltaproteobacteria bacterium]
MKALVIAPQPFFSPRGTPLSVYYRTLVTAELGVDIDLLTYGEGWDVDIPGVRIIRIPRFSFLGNVKIGPSYLKLFLDLFIIIWTIGLLVKNRYDFVHAHEESVFFCRFLKPIFRFKMIYDMHSSLPQQLTNFQFTKSRFLIDLFKKLEDTSLRAADAVITICPDLANYVDTLINEKGKHLLIENSIFDQVRLLPQTTKKDQTNTGAGDGDTAIDLPEGKRFVVYAGTLEPYQGIDILINAFKEVHARDESALLLIVGGTNQQVVHYRDMAEKAGVERSVIFTGRVYQTVAKHYCNLASVLVSPRSDGTNTPLKIYEYLYSGIPMVATDIYSHTQVLDDDVAFLVKPEPEDMARGILSALTSEEARKRKVENACSLYERKYSRIVYEAKMKKLLEIIG